MTNLGTNTPEKLNASILKSYFLNYYKYKELNNLSDDENQEEFDESATEIPTLDTYVPREPSYDVANALPFKELCRRYVHSLFDYIYHQIILGKSSNAVHTLYNLFNESFYIIYHF